MEKTNDRNKPGGLIRLLAIFLALPLVAFVAARGIEWKLDSELHEALLKEFPAKAEDISKISVAALCGGPAVRADPAIGDVCGLSDRMGFMKLGAVIAAVGGIALRVGIKLAAVASRRRRFLLLWLFAPGLHVTMFVLSGLTVLHGALGIATIYYGESALVGRIHIGLMLALGLGALVGVLSMIRAQLSAVKKATTTVLGKKLEPEEHPRLWKFIDEVATAVGAEQPKAIVAGVEPNFYVTEAEVVCLDGRLEGRTMYL